MNLTFYNGQPYKDLLMFYSGTICLPLDYTKALKSMKILKIGTALLQNQHPAEKSQKNFKRCNDPFYLQKPI